MTGIVGARLRGDPPVDRQTVVVRELVAGAYRAARLDEHAAVVVLERSAVGCARMIDPARGVAAPAAVDDLAVGKLEDERMMRIVGIAIRQGVDRFPGVAFAPIL